MSGDDALVSVVRDLMRKVSDCFKIIQVQQEQQREMNDKMNQMRAEIYALRELLGGKADKGHTHSPDGIAGLSELISKVAHHQHSVTDVTGLVDRLGDLAPINHRHTISQVEGLQVAMVKKADKDHTHAEGHIEGLQGDLERAEQALEQLKNATARARPKMSEIEGLEEALGLKADAHHTHHIGSINDLKQELDTRARADHTHSTAQVRGLQEQLFLKCDKDHQHAASSITGLEAMLAEKADLEHSHSDASIEGLREKLKEVRMSLVDHQAQLDDKANNETISNMARAHMEHRHELKDIEGLLERLDR